MKSGRAFTKVDRDCLECSGISLLAEKIRMTVMTGYAEQVPVRDMFRRGKSIRKVAEMVSPEALRFFIEYTLRQLKGFVPKGSQVEYTVIFNGQDKMTFSVPQIYEEEDKLEPDTQIQGTVY